MKRKVSIVMAYYNRRDLFYLTLKSIANSKVSNLELIVVDDCSTEEERVEDLVQEFPFLKVIRVERKGKWWINPCIPFNMGIAKATGDIIVLQNPECIHVGDVLTHIVQNLTDDNFLSISAYALDKKHTGLIWGVPPKRMRSWVGGLPQKQYGIPDANYGENIGWYNHPKYRAVYFHFCSAITKKNLDKLGGFDERYAMGIARDDGEFVDRVKRLKLEMTIPTEVMVIHQCHTKVRRFSEITYPHGIKKNMMIYKLLTSKENSIYKKNSYAK